MSDKKDQTKTVLVAMTGRLDSTVSAYLLKKQGYRVLGIGVVWTKSSLEKDLFSAWDIPDINAVKKICDELDIPFYGVHGHDIFQAKVAERLISARLSGEVFCLATHLHQALIEILLDKAQKLKADTIATGHYAKLTCNQTTGQYRLMTASDLEQDQSFLLGQLNQDQMQKLIFPLAEVRQNQVKKIESLLNFELFPPVKRTLNLDSKNLSLYIESNSAEVFHKEGLILNYREGDTLGDHLGIHHYRLGQNKVELKGGVSLDPNLRIVLIDSYKGNVFVDRPEELFVDTIVLSELKIDTKWDVSKPIEVYVQAGLGVKKLPAMMLLKNNNLAVLTYQEIFQGLVPLGEQIVVYDREGVGAKVIASARVLKAGLMTDNGIEMIPKSLENKDDEKTNKSSKKKIKRESYGL